jgi:AcrR family transcriptional regulator
VVEVQIDERPGSARWWEAHAARMGRRRPRSGGLTVERIVDAALHLVDDEGLDALTVRRLAGALGTSSATLYRHVASVEELLVLVIDRVLGDIELPSSDQPGRDRVVWLSVEFRRVLLEHPGVVPALRAAPLLGPNAMRGAENGLANLLAMDLPAEVAVSGYLALIDFVLGSVFFDTARAGQRHPTVGAPEALPRGRSSLSDHGAALTSAVSSDVFRFGLDAFLDGLEGRRRRSG